MPANNTNTRLVTYTGDDPELRKFIHTWDSTVFDYVENENEKILYPRCGHGYCIYRNVKDIIIKMPEAPYEGDTFAIMDITNINEDYVDTEYRAKGTLIKEEPITNDLSLRTGEIYIDNSYKYGYKTRVIYNDNTYQAGDIFKLEETCCHVYYFCYSSDINAWTLQWLEKECKSADCGCTVKVIIRFHAHGYDGLQYDYDYGYNGSKNEIDVIHEEVFNVSKNSVFRKAYKNYEIYNFYSVKLAEREGYDVVDVRDYIDILKSMKDLRDEQSTVDKICKLDDLYQSIRNTIDINDWYDSSYGSYRLICTYNTIDNDIVYNLPFETGFNGIFYDFNMYAAYRYYQNKLKSVLNITSYNPSIIYNFSNITGFGWSKDYKIYDIDEEKFYSREGLNAYTKYYSLYGPGVDYDKRDKFLDEEKLEVYKLYFDKNALSDNLSGKGYPLQDLYKVEGNYYLSFLAQYIYPLYYNFDAKRYITDLFNDENNIEDEILAQYNNYIKNKHDTLMTSAFTYEELTEAPHNENILYINTDIIKLYDSDNSIFLPLTTPLNAPKEDFAYNFPIIDYGLSSIIDVLYYYGVFSGNNDSIEYNENIDIATHNNYINPLLAENVFFLNENTVLNGKERYIIDYEALEEYENYVKNSNEIFDKVKIYIEKLNNYPEKYYKADHFLSTFNYNMYATFFNGNIFDIIDISSKDNTTKIEVKIELSELGKLEFPHELLELSSYTLDKPILYKELYEKTYVNLLNNETRGVEKTFLGLLNEGYGNINRNGYDSIIDSISLLGNNVAMIDKTGNKFIDLSDPHEWAWSLINAPQNRDYFYEDIKYEPLSGSDSYVYEQCKPTQSSSPTGLEWFEVLPFSVNMKAFYVFNVYLLLDFIRNIDLARYFDTDELTIPFHLVGNPNDYIIAHKAIFGLPDFEITYHKTMDYLITWDESGVEDFWGRDHQNGTDAFDALKEIIDLGNEPNDIFLWHANFDVYRRYMIKVIDEKEKTLRKEIAYHKDEYINPAYDADVKQHHYFQYRKREKFLSMLVNIKSDVINIENHRHKYYTDDYEVDFLTNREKGFVEVLPAGTISLYFDIDKFSVYQNKGDPPGTVYVIDGDNTPDKNPDIVGRWEAYQYGFSLLEDYYDDYATEELFLMYDEIGPARYPRYYSLPVVPDYVKTKKDGYKAAASKKYIYRLNKNNYTSYYFDIYIELLGSQIFRNLDRSVTLTEDEIIYRWNDYDHKPLMQYHAYYQYNYSHIFYSVRYKSDYISDIENQIRTYSGYDVNVKNISYMNDNNDSSNHYSPGSGRVTLQLKSNTYDVKKFYKKGDMYRKNIPFMKFFTNSSYFLNCYRLTNPENNMLESYYPIYKHVNFDNMFWHWSKVTTDPIPVQPFLYKEGTTDVDLKYEVIGFNSSSRKYTLSNLSALAIKKSDDPLDYSIGVIDYNINKLKDFYENGEIIDEVYYTLSIDEFIKKVEEFLNAETVFEFTVTGDETIINVFWNIIDGDYYTPPYYGGGSGSGSGSGSYY